MAAHPAPVEFPPETFPAPHLEKAGRNVATFRILSEDGVELPPGETIFVMKQDDPANNIRAQHAYLLLPGRAPHILYHHYVERGQMFDCQVARRTDDTTFKLEPNFVKIKRLNRQVVDPMRDEGHPENAYNEIYILQEHGDGVHIAELKEALIDDQFLYLVMPLYSVGSLDGCVPPGQGFMSSGYDARPLILRLVENTLYFHRELRLVHRDLSPEQVLLEQESCVITDFAMALRVTVLEGRPQLLTAQPPAGKLPYMPPEIRHSLPFSFAVDKWCLAGTIFFLLTGLHLYQMPNDPMFNHFLVLNGLDPAQDAFNRRIEEQLLEVKGGEQHPLVLRIKAVRRLKPSIRDLLVKLMKLNPNERMSLEDVHNHPWFHEPDCY